MAQPENAHEKSCSCYDYRNNANKEIDTDDIHDSKNQEKHNQPDCEVSNVLSLQSLKLNGFVYPFIDMIDACHDLDPEE